MDESSPQTVPEKLSVIVNERIRILEYRRYSGLYLLKTEELVNGMPFWIKKDSSRALWWYQNHWTLGNIDNLGEYNGCIIGPLKNQMMPNQITENWYFRMKDHLGQDLDLIENKICIEDFTRYAGTILSNNPVGKTNSKLEFFTDSSPPKTLRLQTSVKTLFRFEDVYFIRSKRFHDKFPFWSSEDHSIHIWWNSEFACWNIGDASNNQKNNGIGNIIGPIGNDNMPNEISKGWIDFDEPDGITFNEAFCQLETNELEGKINVH